MSFRIAIGHLLGQSSLQKDGEPDVKLNGELHRDHRLSLRCDELEAMLIYSMSVSRESSRCRWSLPHSAA